MTSAPVGENEADRLAALYGYRILDTQAEQEFDEITELAAQICGVPIALVSLIDADRQWFKSRIGLEAEQTARGVSFCAHAIQQGAEIFEVPNALEDARFFDNPLVTDSPEIRFYAGTPLVTPEGFAVGTLCVIDTVPRTLSEQQQKTLRLLGRQVVRQMEQRLVLRREKKLRKALSQRARFQQALLDSAAVAIITTDVHGILTSANPATCRLLGYAPEEIMGCSVIDTFHVREELEVRARELSQELGSKVGWRNALVARVLLGQPETREWHYRRKDGQLVPVELTASALRDEDGGLYGYVGMSLDISERKNALAALRNSEARLQMAMSAARINLWDANPETGRITLDARWLEFIGDEPVEKEMSLAELAELVPSQEAPRVLAQLMATVKGEQPDYVMEHRVRHRDGHWIWIESRGRVVERDGAGRALRLIGTNIDITERKRVEQLKSEFVSMVSHELRTPLTSIGGALGLVCGGALGEMPAQVRSMLDIAYKNSQRLMHLINDLLDMEKLEAGMMRFDFKETELMPLVEQAIESTKAYAEQYRVPLVLAEHARGVRVRVDTGRLLQVLSNYLSNAVKFSPQGAPVEVRVSMQPDWVRVEVADHGEGVPLAFRERIFQKFSQADASDSRQKGGTGLGLAISKELMERMSGRVGFASPPGEGARFYFELPRVHMPPVLATAGS
ncbi:MAG: PAS domain S-box protein [Burkholderiales bacterium]|nr:PAS domain S-box protein [Burkholderiales bacterium]